MLEVNFGKSILNNSKWDKIIEGYQKTHIWKRVRLSLGDKNIIRNQILVSKLWYIGQIYTIPKYQKGNWKKNMQFPLEQEKIEPPRQWAQLSIWRDRLGILLFQTDTKLNLTKIKWIQSLLNPTNAPCWKDLMLYFDWN